MLEEDLRMYSGCSVHVQDSRVLMKVKRISKAQSEFDFAEEEKPSDKQELDTFVRKDFLETKSNR